MSRLCLARASPFAFFMLSMMSTQASFAYINHHVNHSRVRVQISARCPLLGPPSKGEQRTFKPVEGGPGGTESPSLPKPQPNSEHCTNKLKFRASKPIQEDDPRYLEGFQPPANSIPGQRPDNSSHASRPPPERLPPDEVEHGGAVPDNPYSKPADIPVPGP
jgi:hypothetical protein